MSEKEENEITVKIKCGMNKFYKILEDKGFNIVEKFSLDDTYFIPSSLEIEKLSTRDILKSAVLVRDIHDKITDKLKKKITFKRKKFDGEGNILSQDAVNCDITSVEEAKRLLIAIGYKEIMNIKENDIGYEKEGFKIVTKDIVNGDKLIEVETNVNNKDLDTIEKLKNKLKEFEVPIDTSNYFVKKAEIELDKILERQKTVPELWDVYDRNKKKTGKTVKRGRDTLKEGEYHIAVAGIILNSKNEILITKRAAHKELGLMWELNGGSILAGETSLEGIIRELKEEIGVEFSKKDAIYLKDVIREKMPPCFKELWLFRKDVDEKEITFPDGEAIDYKWVTIEEFMDMYNRKEIVETVDFEVEDYNMALKLKQRETYGYIGNKVKVKIDRPLGSKHPEHGFIYEVNYGYVPNTVSGDGEELDCYVLGVDKPINEFEGLCIAVIHRTNDDDDKLIVVPEGMEFSDEEIRTLANFQEQYFESEIIR